MVKKSTQCGISEWLVIQALAKAIQGRSVFYVLPTDLLKNRFVQNRFDKSVRLVKHYSSQVGEQTENLSLKHFGNGAIAFVGSNTPNLFTEFPADDLIIDELDRCDQDNILMAEERLAASKYRTRIKVSNPTFEGVGIAKLFTASTARQWVIPHGCGHRITPDFFKHVVLQEEDHSWVVADKDWDEDSGADPRLICDKCSKPFDRFADGEWVATRKSDVEGIHISKLFSTNTSVLELIHGFSEGLANDKKMERFYNADLGLEYASKGAKIDGSMLDACVDMQHRFAAEHDGPCIMGIDVGSVLHVTIGIMSPNGKTPLVYAGTVDDYDDIKQLHRRYNVKVGVIDALPETRLSKRVVATLPGMFMCFYRNVSTDVINPRHRIVSVDRDSALDGVKEQIVTEGLVLPPNARSIPDLYKQIVSSTRTFDDKKGKYVWIETGPDHYLHSLNYLFIARKLGLNLSARNR